MERKDLSWFLSDKRGQRQHSEFIHDNVRHLGLDDWLHMDNGAPRLHAVQKENQKYLHQHKSGRAIKSKYAQICWNLPPGELLMQLFPIAL